MIHVKITNQEEELKSLPINQSIYLEIDKLVDTSQLDNHITLFRVIPEKGLISLVEPYSYNIGYIKEKFNTVQLDYTLSELSTELFSLEIKPKKALELDSDYILYISKTFSICNTSVVKESSKTNSSVKIVPDLPVAPKQITLTITSTSKLTDSTNNITFTINDVAYSLNLKQQKEIKVNGIKFIFTDTVYVLGEKFNITLSNEDRLIEDTLYKLRTAPSSTIKVIDNQKASTSINTQTVLDFYQKVNTIPTTTIQQPKYLSPNIFTISLPEGYSLNRDKEVLINIKEAFNNYLLNNLELYDIKLKYKIYMYQEDSELIIEVIYQETGEDLEVVNEDEEPIIFKKKRAGL